MTRLLTIGYDAADPALMISGDENGFRELVTALRSPEKGPPSTSSVQPRPRLGPLPRLGLALGGDDLIVEISGDTAYIGGSRDRLGAVAEDIETFMAYNDLAEPGMHMHVDCGSESPLGLILAGPVPDQPL